jgi:hypothetical protein
VTTRAVVVELDLRARLSNAEARAVAAAANAYSEFLRLPVELRDARSGRGRGET